MIAGILLIIVGSIKYVISQINSNKDEVLEIRAYKISN